MDHQENPYFPLAVGPVTIGIRFDIVENTEAFSRYFSGYASPRTPDLLMDFTVVGHDDVPFIPESLIQAKTWHQDKFTIASDLFKGSFDRERNTWNVIVKNIMTKGQITRVFEQFLYQAFYSACAKSGKKALLIHSAGVTMVERGFLFVGASGMGKSTVAGLSRAYGIMNDEMNVLSYGPSGFLLNRSPFNAYFDSKSGSAERLSAVFLLRHSATCRLEPVSGARAVAELTGQIVPRLGLEDAFSPAAASDMMSAAEDLVRTVPVRYLHFPVEGGFWPLILDQFQ